MIYLNLRRDDKVMIRLMNLMHRKVTKKRSNLFFLDADGHLKRFVFEHLNHHERYV